MGSPARFLSETQKRSLNFVRDQLSEGAKPFAELQMQARAARVPLRSLTASRKILNVVVSRNGQKGEFFWSLPG